MTENTTPLDEFSETLSIIIPAYNEETYITECLECIVRNAPSWLREVIVVDNASTDKTAEVVEKFAVSHPLVRLVREDKKGVQNARQKGFLESTGTLLAFVDADTRMPHNWYENLLKNFSRNNKLVCLSGPILYNDISMLFRFTERLYWYICAIPLYIIVGYMAMGGNLVIKKETLEKMGGFDTSIVFYGDDTDTSRRASKFGKMKFSIGFATYSSSRRLKQQGVLATNIKYIRNYFSQVFLHKSVDHTNETFR